MPTVTDRSISKSLLSAARGADEVNDSGDERTNGFLVAIYQMLYPEFGNTPFPAGKLNRKIPQRLVLGMFDVGEIPANRNLSDREVVGSRLPSQGLVEILGHPHYTVRITEAGSRRAEELIASCRA